LNYAETNRKEWEMKGEEVVKLYVAKYGRKNVKHAADVTETTTEQWPDHSSDPKKDGGKKL
jgi:hypothetical protein